MTAFARNLNNLMSRLALTQKDIAHGAGVSEAAITGWMQGADPRASCVFAIAKRHNVTMESLMDDPTAPHIAALEHAVHRRCWDLVKEKADILVKMEFDK